MSLFHRLSIFAITSYALCFSALELGAATIAWGDPTLIQGDSDILTSGTQHYSYRFAGSTGTSTVINGITFTRVTPVTSAGTMTVTLGGGNVTFATTDDAGNDGRLSAAALEVPTAGVYLTLSEEYQTLLGAVAYNASTNNAYTVQLNNLVVGQNYRIQIWANESRAPKGIGYTMVDGVRLDTNDSNAAGGVGQFATGYFLADSVSQVIHLGRAQYINGLSLFAVPEPQSLPLVACVAVGGYLMMRRNRPS